MVSIAARFLLLAYLVFLFIPPSIHAQSGNAQFILDPNNASAAAGDTFTVGILINSGTEPVNAVQANLAYPAEKLDFDSTNVISSAFSIQAENSGGSGIVKIARGSITPVTGEVKVANVFFRVKQPVTAQEVVVAPDSAIVSSVTNTNMYQGSFTVKNRGGLIQQFQQSVSQQSVTQITPGAPGQIQVIPNSRRSMGNGGFFEKLVLFNVAIWEKIFSVIEIFTKK